MYMTIANEEIVTARAYELSTGDWEVHFSDTPMDIPSHVQEDDFPDFLRFVRGAAEGIDEILLYPWNRKGRGIFLST